MVLKKESSKGWTHKLGTYTEGWQKCLHLNTPQPISNISCKEPPVFITHCNLRERERARERPHKANTKSLLVSSLLPRYTIFLIFFIYIFQIYVCISWVFVSSMLLCDCSRFYFILLIKLRSFLSWKLPDWCNVSSFCIPWFLIIPYVSVSVGVFLAFWCLSILLYSIFFLIHFELISLIFLSSQI